MGRIDLRKFDDIRHLVRARLSSSEFHDLVQIVKEHIDTNERYIDVYFYVQTNHTGH